MSKENNVTVVPETKEAAVFSVFNAQLAEWVEKSKTVVFDLADKVGNKEARSFVALIRKSKKPVTDAHKAAKAESLEFGKKLDAEKNRIIAAIDEVIDVYAKPLAEIEEAEAARIANIKQRILQLNHLAESGNADGVQYNSEQLTESLNILNAIVIDDSFAEFESMAEQSKEAAVSRLGTLVTTVAKQEVDAAELSRLQALEKARLQQVHDDKIRDEATEAAEARLLPKEELKTEPEVIEEVQTPVENIAEDTVSTTVDTGREHRKQINNEALNSLEANNIPNAKELVTLIAKGYIKHVTINYQEQ